MRTVELYDKKSDKVLIAKTVEDDQYQSTYRRLKLQSELDNEGLSERRYDVREKKEE